MTNFSAGSAFAGIGGFDFGFERAGFKVLWQIESHKGCRKFLAKNFPNAILKGDVYEVLQHEESLPTVGVIFGGDPCQSFSGLATNGRKGDRLDGAYLCLLARERPRWIVRENVLRGDFESFECALELLGYEVRTFVIDARGFTNQSRPRAFTFGSLAPGGIQRLALYFVQQESEFAAAKAANSVEAENGKGLWISCIDTEVISRVSVHQTIFCDRGKIRSFNLSELCRLQGFTPEIFTGIHKRPLGKMIGNAVNVEVSYFIARAIACADEPNNITMECNTMRKSISSNGAEVAAAAPQPQTAERRTALLAQWFRFEHRMSYRPIAKLLGIHHRTVWKYCMEFDRKASDKWENQTDVVKKEIEREGRTMLQQAKTVALPA